MASGNWELRLPSWLGGLSWARLTLVSFQGPVASRSCVFYARPEISNNIFNVYRETPSLIVNFRGEWPYKLVN